MEPLTFQRPRRFFHLWHSLAAILISLLAVGITTGAVQAAVPGEINSCSQAHSQCLALSYQDASGASHPLTDSNGQAVDPATEHLTSGNVITIKGTNWDPSQPFQVWLSQPFSDLSKEPTNNECYVRVDASASPNADGTFTRSVTMPTLDYNTYPDGAFITVEAGSRGIGCIASDRPANQSVLDAENSAFEVTFKAYPLPPAAPCSVQQNNPCLTVSPGVVYPGNTVTVAGQGWSGSSVGLYIYSGTTADCTVVVGNATTTQGNFSTTIAAPPLPTLPPVIAGSSNLPVPFQVLAISPAPTGSTCAGSGETKSAALYVSQPTLSVTTNVYYGNDITITGNHWAASSGGSSAAKQAVNVALFVGPDGSSFNCANAKTYTVASNVTDPNDGTFTVTFPADKVSQDTNKQVRALAVPSGASAASLCGSVAPDATTCQQAQTTAVQCPLMAVESTFKLVPVPAVSVNWVYILVPLGLLLLLLPLFFLLGRREEDEVIITEQDVTVERELANTSAPTNYTDATFARTIRITRSIVNPRTGKVKDQEIEEYDVFRDAQDREVRRLRQPGKTVVTPQPPQPTPGPATSV